MRYAICVLIGYLVGMLNPAYFLAKFHGIDIRTRGSGNAGASNAMLVFGKLRGALCALFDIGKAVAVVCLTRALFPGDPLVFAVAASACILGHIFPFYMGFRGGKGLACLAGVILAYDLRVFAVLLAAEAVVMMATRYICFVPMSASAVFPVLYGFMLKFEKDHPALFDGQMLHAKKLRFIHPRTGKEVELESPLPNNFTRALELLRPKD